ncbi:MAG: universal stress protein [Bacteroidales bacterium]
MTKKILIPVDFSDASTAALHVALTLANAKNLGLSLVHIADGKSAEKAESELQSLTEKLKKENNLNIEPIVKKGNIFSGIASIANDNSFGLMIIGTHGFKGIREKVFGADILKLVKSVAIPVMVVQKEYKLPPEGIKKILFPASSHDTFSFKIESTIYLSNLTNAEVLLYTVEKPGIEWSDKFRENIRLAKREFEDKGIKFTRINEEQQSFSVGYSKQIMAYAKNNHVDLIALMSNAAGENYYFADSDKGSILTNDANIPVLCTSDKQIV